MFRKNYHSYTDEQLMQAIAKGKERAFAELYERYGQKIYRYFYRLLYQDVEKANDFTQDLFLKIVERPEMFDIKRRFSTWIYTVAGNMCKNEYRRNSKYQIVNEVPERENWEMVHWLDNKMDEPVFKTYLQKALESLDEIPRQCFVLRYQQELSIREISEILDCPEGTVKSRLYYTVRKLSEKLKAFR